MKKKSISNKYFFGKDFNILRAENGFIQYQDQLGEIILPEPNLLGDHQLGNISTSIAATRKLFNIKDEHIKKGVTKIKLKGRLQEIKSGKLKNLIGKNRLIIDGGHNIGASIALSNSPICADNDPNIFQTVKVLGYFLANFMASLNASDNCPFFERLRTLSKCNSGKKIDSFSLNFFKQVSSFKATSFLGNLLRISK